LRVLPPERIARMTDVDYEREMAFIAVRENREIAGVSRLVRNDTDGAAAEFAVIVDPGAKQRGIATELMQCVIDWGRSQGVTLITGQILADNIPMLAFVRRLGFELRHIAGEHDIVEASLVCGSEPKA
jgi:acetyltransferase